MTDRQSQVLNELQYMKDYTIVFETQKEVLQQAINDLATLYVNYPQATGARGCAGCRHYVVTDVKHNYDQGGCGTYDQYIYGCENWECEFSAKEDDANG